MSGAPQIDLDNQSSFASGDRISTGMHADTDAFASNSTHSDTRSGDSPQFVTKESILNCKVGDKASSAHCRDAANVKHHSLICTSHTIPSSSLTRSKAAQSAMSAVNNHPTTQNLKESINNGEVRTRCRLV